MEITKISEYFTNIDNMNSIYMFKIKNSEKGIFNITKDSINFFKLEFIKEIKGIFSHENLTFNNVVSENENIIKFTNNNSFVFLTNDNLNNLDKEFFIFTLNKNTEIVQEFYYLSNETFKSVIPEELNVVLWTLNLINIKTLNNLNPSKIIFQYYDNYNSNNNLSKIDEIKLSFNNSIMIHSIIIKGDLFNTSTGQQFFNQNLNLVLKNKIFFAPSFVNPIKIENNSYNLFLSSFQQTFLLNLDIILANFSIHNNEIDLRNILDNDNASFEVVLNCIKVTKALLTNYSNINEFNNLRGSNQEEKINSFKEIYFNGSDPQTYCDYLIRNQITLLENKNRSFLSQKLQAIILALSEFIKSSFCWKNGLTEEHKFGLIWYINTSNQNFYLNSLFINFKNFDNKFLGIFNLNSVFYNNKTISYPNLLSKLEEQNISNSPLDFNKNSFNFNFLFWIPFNSAENLKKFFKSSISSVTTRNEIYSHKFIFKDKNEILRYKNDLVYLELKMREAINIHASFRLKENSLKIIKEGVASYKQEETFDMNDPYNPTFYNVPNSWFIEVEAIYVINEPPPKIKTNFWYQNNLDFQNLLISKNIYENIELNLILDQKLTNQGFLIKKINQIYISSLLGNNINIDLLDKTNHISEVKFAPEHFDKTKNYQVELNSVNNSINTQTIINF